MQGSTRTWVLVSVTIAVVAVALIHLAIGPGLVSLVPDRRVGAVGSGRASRALPDPRADAERPAGRRQGEERALVAEPAPPPQVRLDGGPLPPDACAFDARASFQAYVQELRALEEPAQRLAELARPARAILSLRPERRRALGVLDTRGFRLERTLGHTTLECALSDSLAERWLACAEAQGRRDELRAAVHELLRCETEQGLAAADPALLALACSFSARFGGEEDLRALFPWFPARVEGALADPELADTRVLPVLALLAPAGRFAWARGDVLRLGARPWLRLGPHLHFFLSLATAGGSFGEWEETLADHLASPSTDARWTALQVLRTLASRRAADGSSTVEAERLVSLLPSEIHRSEDALLRRAALELLASSGGRAGRAVLEGLLEDPRVPRNEVLAALAPIACDLDRGPGSAAPARSDPACLDER